MGTRLAEELRRLRRIRGVTLREVENKTKISNAYLSQLANGKAENPSPHILHKLAGFYGVPYEFLMEAAGYLQPQQSMSLSQKKLSRIQAALLGANFDEEEQETIAEFIEFLRSQRRHRSK